MLARVAGLTALARRFDMHGGDYELEEDIFVRLPTSCGSHPASWNRKFAGEELECARIGPAPRDLGPIPCLVPRLRGEPSTVYPVDGGRRR